MDKVAIAKEIMKIAYRLVASDNPRSVTAATVDEKAELEKTAKLVVAKKAEFEAANKAIIDEIKAMEKAQEELKEKLAEKQKQLGESFKVFDKEVGFSKLTKSIANTVATEMSVKGDIAALLGNLSEAEKAIISYKESEQYSYKGLWETLVSMLNGTEFEKYVNLLKDGAKKNIVEVQRVVGQLNTVSKTFDSKYQKTYEERAKEWNDRNPGNPLPAKIKASVGGVVKTAGIVDVFKLIGGWITKLYSNVKTAIVGLCKFLVGRDTQLEQANAFILKLNEAAKKVAK